MSTTPVQPPTLKRKPSFGMHGQGTAFGCSPTKTMHLSSLSVRAYSPCPPASMLEVVLRRHGLAAAVGANIDIGVAGWPRLYPPPTRKSSSVCVRLNICTETQNGAKLEREHTKASGRTSTNNWACGESSDRCSNPWQAVCGTPSKMDNVEAQKKPSWCKLKPHAQKPRKDVKANYVTSYCVCPCFSCLDKIVAKRKKADGPTPLRQTKQLYAFGGRALPCQEAQ